MTVHLCLAYRDEDGHYTTHAAAVLVSVLKQSSVPVVVHILHDDTLKEQQIHTLSTVVQYYGHNLVFHDVQQYVSSLNNLKIPQAFGLGSFFRYCIPKFVQADFAIYLDCDVCFTMDIARLYAEVQKNPSAIIACVRDQGVMYKPSIRSYVTKRGFVCDQYFNSGVLGLNLHEIRHCFTDLLHTMIKCTLHEEHSLLPDQDALNRIFRKMNLHWLPFEYNFQMPVEDRMLMEEDALDGKILHYSCYKPWFEIVLPGMMVHKKNYEILYNLLQ